MDQSQIKKLKVAAEQFYLNEHQDIETMSDADYDVLAKQYESETGKSVKDLVDWPEQLVLPNVPEAPLEKEIVRDNDLESAFKNWCNNRTDEIWVNLKYDGAAIKLIYDEKGKLQMIQSTPDEKLGIIRTEQFWNLVPHNIPSELGIQCIRGEVLVDAGVYGKLARNKANGLVNSTVNQDEIEREAFIRWYKLTYFDGDWTSQRQLRDMFRIPAVHKYRSRTEYNQQSGKFELGPTRFDFVFYQAQFISEFPIDAIYLESINGQSTLKFQCDGIVAYASNEVRGFKFYFTDSAVTTVTDVVWNQQSNGSYAAVLHLDPIELDEKNIKQVTSGGVNNLIGISDNSPGAMGVGAKVRVILANTTIPKVVEVLEESHEFNWPKCECGYQMSEKDRFGNVLKCGNTEVCSYRYNLWLPEVIQWILDENKSGSSWGTVESVRHAIARRPEWFAYVFHIDGWDPFDKLKVSETNELDSERLMYCEAGPSEVTCQMIRTWFDDLFNYTDKKYELFELNLKTGIKVLQTIIQVDSMEGLSKLLEEINGD